MTDVILVLPIVVPLVAAVAALIAWRHPGVQRAVSTAAALAHVAAAVWLLRTVAAGEILAVQVGNWPAPFGITLVADLFGAIMVTLAAVIGAAVAIYSLTAIDAPREAFGYHALVQMLLAGVSGAFLTGDIRTKEAISSTSNQT